MPLKIRLCQTEITGEIPLAPDGITHSYCRYANFNGGDAVRWYLRHLLLAACRGVNARSFAWDQKDRRTLLLSGMEEAEKVVRRFLAPLLLKEGESRNFKGELQEFLQARGQEKTVYTVVKTEGAPHAPLFTVCAEGAGRAAFGKGHSKAEAEKAAARALKDRSRENVYKVVKKIVGDRMALGQFEECEITLKELSIIINTVVNSLTGVYHRRIEYPKISFEGMEGDEGAPAGKDEQKDRE